MNRAIVLISFLILTVGISSCLSTREDEFMKDKFITLQETYFPDGTVKEEWQVYPEDSTSGRYLKFNESGVVIEEHWYVNNQLEGPLITYYDNGVIAEYEVYRNQGKYGDAYKFDSLGKITEYSFHQGKGYGSFKIDYIENAIESDLGVKYFDYVFHKNDSKDPRFFDCEFFYARPPYSKIRMTLTELDEDSVPLNRFDLPLDTFSFHHQKYYTSNKEIRFTLEYFIEDTVYSFRDTAGMEHRIVPKKK